MYFFPDDHSDIISEIYAIAERYFKPFNKTIVTWDIVEKISNSFDEDSSENASFTSENFDTVLKDFHNLIEAKTSLDQVEKLRREERRIEKVINIIRKFSTLCFSITDDSGVRSTLKLFHDNLRALIQDFLTQSQTDANPVASFCQRMRDVSAHMVQQFLETEIYPRANVCETCIKVASALQKFENFPNSTKEAK